MASPFISNNQSSSKLTINGVSSITGNIDIPLSSLSDVVLDSISCDQILTYDNLASKWKNATLAFPLLSSLSDCSILTPSDKQVLQYDSANSLWKNSTLNLVTALSSLSDCTI